MKTSTFLFLIITLALFAVSCETLMTPDPVTGVTPAAEAGGALVDSLVKNPSVIGVVEGLVAAGGVIAAAFFGRKKIAAGARFVGRVAGVVQKKTE